MHDGDDITELKKHEAELKRHHDQLEQVVKVRTLELSKIEAGKLVLEESAVSIGGIAANVASILQEEAQARKLKLIVESHASTHRLLGDPTRLQQRPAQLCEQCHQVHRNGRGHPAGAGGGRDHR